MVYALIHTVEYEGNQIQEYLAVVGDNVDWIMSELEKERLAYSWDSKDCEIRKINNGWDSWFLLSQLTN